MPQSRTARPATGSRRRRSGTDLASLQSLVDQLIKENRQLKRQLEKLASSVGGDLRPISGLIRRLERGLAEATGGRGRRAAKTVTVRRPRPAPSPETLEKRKQALAKARAARAEKALQRAVATGEVQAATPE